MDSLQIAVKLNTPDPQAITALNAIKAMRLQLPPLKIQRYDLWDFEVIEGGIDTVSNVVKHFSDIVNPNKQSWMFAGEEISFPEEDTELQWVGIVVKDFVDSISDNWTELLKRREFPVLSLSHSVLWRMGYLIDTDEALVKKMALDLAVSKSRSSGLFSNPISQEVFFWS